MDRKKIMHAKQVNLKEAETALIIAPYNTADFILSTPAIAALKQAMAPKSRLTAVVSKRALGLAKKACCIDRVVPMRGPVAILTALMTAAGSYDVLVNFEPNHNSSMLISLMARSRVKVAYALKNEKKLHNALHNLQLRTLETPEHKTIEYLNLVRFIGANSYDFEHKIRISEEDKSYAGEFMKKNEITGSDVIIGIHPVLKDEKKRWAINKFHQLIRSLVEKFNAKIIVYYHEDEKDRLEEFMHVIRNKALLADTTDYGKLMAMATYFSCFVCNETDFMHLLAPFTNLVVIWGGTDPDNNKPSGNRHEIIRPMDGNADSVPVSNVMDAVKKFIEQQGL
ncbi:MAG TPA: glycosyltransferase family 9 protein [Candidatus Goldiibacteriota bacterium]|nr:glycosyltransferase family 9 protein [Candidatus Goldiibacteriota bacterium]